MEKSNTETKLISVRIPLELHDFILSPLNNGSITDFTIEALKVYGVTREFGLFSTLSNIASVKSQTAHKLYTT